MPKSQPSAFEKHLHNKLAAREQDNLLRKLTIPTNLIDFSSNDYLGLSRCEELYNLIQEKVQNLPHHNGATGSRLLTGNSAYTEQVEATLANVFKAEAALLFNSGYAANQGVISCIALKGDTIIYDELAHACMRDGARLSLANRYPFRHNDLQDLEDKLKKATGNIFIAVESIYSMDGDTCPLEELITLADTYSATIILDEAHSTGILGERGNGLATTLGLEKKIPIRIYTFGKAMGVHGACVVGTRALINYLVNFSRTFIFTTAMPIHGIAAIDCSFNYLTENIQLQQMLQEKINHFLNVSAKINSGKLKSKSQIQGIIIPGNEKIKEAANALQLHGFDVRPIVSPTVGKGTERLRICLHTYNSEEEMSQLVDYISRLI
jgi:8-amino-7-oxononanoate synthase